MSAIGRKQPFANVRKRPIADVREFIHTPRLVRGFCLSAFFTSFKRIERNGREKCQEILHTVYLPTHSYV